MHRIGELEREISDLRRQLLEKENELCDIKRQWVSGLPVNTTYLQTSQSCYNSGEQEYNRFTKCQVGDKLPRWAIERYSRQILLPEIGVAGQEKLCAAKVLIVGAGGLGCPAALYLAGAGVGEIGIIDYDTVDITNIHRQVLHEEKNQFMRKVDSAVNALKRINSHIKITPYNVQLDSSNALKYISQYNIILDCTDNVPTRYLLNDACVISKVPLISGSALKMEGQITIYGYREENPQNGQEPYIGPCYRCLFPVPPPAEVVGSCSANGVAGPVPAVIGALQAMETIKWIVGISTKRLLVQRMVLYDAEDATFRTIKLRPRNPQCAVCSQTPSVTQLIDYEQFCQARATDKPKTDGRARRREEKAKRMTGQSYLGFRRGLGPEQRKWVQDVQKSERKMGAPCRSEVCRRSGARHCARLDDSRRLKIFNHFWNELDWAGKKRYALSLVDTTPPKRRRVKNSTRKCDTNRYHLTSDAGDKLQVCRIMFMNTLGVGETMVRCWLRNKDKGPIKKTRPPLKTLNVASYLDGLAQTPPKCRYCRTMSSHVYVDVAGVSNQFQLYKMYVRDMKLRGFVPAARKTFSQVLKAKNMRIFKPKSDGDCCDMVSQHNVCGYAGDVGCVQRDVQTCGGW